MGSDGIQSQVLRLVALPKVARKALVMALDCTVCIGVVPIAFWLRLGEWEFATRRVLIFAGIALFTWILVSLVTKTYRSVTRFAGQHTRHPARTCGTPRHSSSIGKPLLIMQSKPANRSGYCFTSCPLNGRLTIRPCGAQ